KLKLTVTMTVILPSDMNALLLRFHNFFFPLWQGEDRVCKCFCGSQQAYRVVPYEGAMSTVDSRENFFGSDIMTQQNMDVIVGLCSGILITWLLMWLNRVWKSASQLNIFLQYFLITCCIHFVSCASVAHTSPKHQ
uniref:Uncharacterized protein n=1 Tax=Amphiprion ocellaris TaxID=80972 RepID=A0AAQ5XU53_AMPOC